MERKIALILFSIFVIGFEALSQKVNLLSGPMPGYTEMRESSVWLQTSASALTAIKYRLANSKSHFLYSESISTKKENAFTATFVLTPLLPGKKYEYQIVLNGKTLEKTYYLTTLPDWQHRTDPPDFTFVTGSGAFINDSAYDRKGKAYGGEYGIYNTIAATKPDFMLWLGDNVYLRPADEGSRTGIYYRYTHVRTTPEINNLLPVCHHYAIWDDHDYGPNDADKSYPLKNIALDAFNLFWPMPTKSAANLQGTTNYFRWGDAEFFLLDNRWFRDANNLKKSNRQILGSEQIDWLINALAYSKATFKFIAVGGQFLNPAAVHENHANYAEERQFLIDEITRQQIKGVIFLTGDRHHSEITKLDRKGTYPLYDLTISPFTSGAAYPVPNENWMQVKGSYFNVRNFGQISISGKPNNRTLNLKLIDTNGKLLYEWMVNETDLK